MCRPFSCIITKNQHIYTHPNPLEHSHTEIMNHFNLIDILKGPFPLGEKAIAQVAYYSYDYAAYILKGPFELGEKAIATSASYSYASYSYDYAKNVLKGPFPLGEPAIADNISHGYYYAVNVSKRRFELYEQLLIKFSDAHYFKLAYEQHFNTKL
jgi:hypothetical protein